MKRVLPDAIRRWFRRQPSVGSVQFGSLRRLQPISRVFGFDRGLPIERYYIERFLSSQELDIKGCVLEIANDEYTKKFGGSRVSKSEILHVMEGNPKATIVADLTCADHIPSEIFDCIICTQTLQFIYDVRAATSTLHRILKPGGVLLATSSGISQISRYDMDRWGDYWRFTDCSARELFSEAFGSANVTITTHGNVLVACGYLHGLATHEIDQRELDYHDPDYQVLITVRAIKAQENTEPCSR